MPRKEKRNHAVVCKPVRGRCKASRNGLQEPAGVVRPCPKCDEMRCVKHCRCGRRGVSRKMAVRAPVQRQVTVTAASQQHFQPQQQQPFRVSDFVEVLGASTFWDRALEAVATAKKTVFVASLAFDNSKFLAKLLAARSKGVKVELLLDRKSFKEGLAPKAGERVAKLKAAGAKVFLGSGKSHKRVFGVDGYPGVFHPKVLVVDSVVSFVGSPNSTNASLVNGEVSVKITDAVVAAQVYEQAWKEAQRVESY
jgi:phosphatidylserine/phosphatidylglycerophosphate/cardiolipin synthase-like enzyme